MQLPDHSFDGEHLRGTTIRLVKPLAGGANVYLMLGLINHPNQLGRSAEGLPELERAEGKCGRELSGAQPKEAGHRGWIIVVGC